MNQGEPLGQQLAEQHIGERDAGHAQSDTDRRGVIGEQRQVQSVEQMRDLVADTRTECGAGADADQGDENLDRGQKLLRPLRQIERDLRTPAGLREPFEAQLARSHQRHFAEREKPVQQGEKNNQCDFVDHPVG